MATHTRYVWYCEKREVDKRQTNVSIICCDLSTLCRRPCVDRRDSHRCRWVIPSSVALAVNNYNKDLVWRIEVKFGSPFCQQLDSLHDVLISICYENRLFPPRRSHIHLLRKQPDSLLDVLSARRPDIHLLRNEDNGKIFFVIAPLNPNAFS